MSKDELRARLAKKVEAMRQLRHAEERQKRAESALAFKENALSKGREKKQALQRKAILSGKPIDQLRKKCAQ